MPPTLRSNTLRSPTSDGSTPSTPRKCSKCGRARAGHPRQGCPYVDTDATSDSTSVNEAEHISNASESVHIIPNPYDRPRSSNNQVVAESNLASLSADSCEIVERLLTPGVMDNTNDQEASGVCIPEWQANVSTPTQVKTEPVTINLARPTMPGTLYSPSPSFFQSTEDIFKTEMLSVDSATSQPGTEIYPRPLARTASTDERDAFLMELSEISKPPATVYLLPMADIPDIRKSAEKIGFYSCVVSAGGKSGNGWLILGCDPQAVLTLQQQLQVKKGKQGSKLKAAAGGAVVGAVATWTGLAFS